MTVLRRILLVVLSILVLVLAIGFALPRNVHVERETVVNAPPEMVYARVNDLSRWSEWSPWYAKEPTAKYEFSATTAGVGAEMSWSGEITGQGTQKIVASEFPKSITTQLDFGSQGTAEADWTFEPQGDGTRVVWGFDTDMGLNPIGRYFGLMMDSMLGKDYEDGLRRLKQVCEVAIGDVDGAAASSDATRADASTNDELP